MSFIKNLPLLKRTIPALFAEQVKKYPSKPALIDASSQQILTYEQLWQRAQRLAALLQHHGLQCQSRAPLSYSIAGLLVDRSPGMIAAMMGIIMAGGAYLPLSVDFPTERMRCMLDDCDARILVTELKFKAQAESIKTLRRQRRENAATHIIYIDDCDAPDQQENTSLEPVIAHPDDFVYIIYTSGTTGRPKGVLTRQVNVTRVVVDTNYIDITPDDTLLQLSNYAFDGSVFDIFGALLNGASLVKIDKETVFSPDALAQIINNNYITLFFITTALFNTLVDINLECLAGVRKILVGGERLSLEHVRKALDFLGPDRLMNVYGPTETTVFASFYNINHIPADAVTIPIGFPITDTSIYILDRDMKPVPEETEGEIYIGGSGLAAGYMNNPELTVEKFALLKSLINKSFSGGQGGRLFKKAPLVYKTGDLGKALSQGEIVFTGRVDDQVKIRGFRIEPGEIENRLVAHPDIKEAVVIIKKSEKGDAYLDAYYVPSGPAAFPPAEKELKEYLARFLPAYMIPRFLIPLERMPLNRSGKIDKQALPGYVPAQKTQTMPGETALQPLTNIEKTLAGLCAQLLGLETIGLTEDFFQLGGHSLLAAQLANRIKKMLGVEIPLREIFARPTVRELAEYFQQVKAPETPGTAKEEILPVIRPVSRERVLPLTFQQEQVWFLCRLAPDNKAYNFQFTIRFRGPLETGVLEKCLDTIIQRHEILRTTFQEDEGSSGRPVQVIHEPWKAHIPLQDLRDLPRGEREAKAEELIRQETAQTFDFTRLPLLRWQLYRLDEEDFIYLQVEHHFVHDGWSYAVFLKELKTLYCAFQTHMEPSLPDVPVQYADYAVWQRDLSYTPYFKRQLAYWHEQLAGVPAGLELITDRPRPNVQQFHGRLLRLDLPPELYKALQQLSRDHKVTLFVTLLSGFYILLMHYTGQEDILVGSGVANRRLKEIENMLGMVVNALVLRGNLSGAPVFSELLRRVQQVVLEAHQNQDIPLEKLVEQLLPDRDPGRNPFFQVMFGFHDSPVPALDFGSLKGELLERHNDSAKNDINVIFIPVAEQRIGQGKLGDRPDLTDLKLSLLWEYDSDLFNPGTMQRMVGHYLVLLENMVKEPGKRICDFNMMREEEYHQLLHLWNATDWEYVKDETAGVFSLDMTLADIFENTANRLADRVNALMFGDTTITYKQLDTMAGETAGLLREKGILPGDIVAIMMERSLEMMAGILGILKAGAAYLPIDPAYPQERIEYMLKDSNAKVLIINKSEIRNPKSETNPNKTNSNDQNKKQHSRAVSVLNFEDLNLNSIKGCPRRGLSCFDIRASNFNSSNLSYIIYTSGSTGIPKGVMIEHRSVVNRLNWMQRNYPLTQEDTVLQKTPVTFDVSVWELSWWFFAGAKLALLVPGGEKEPERIIEAIKKYNITTMHFVPSMLNGFLDYLEQAGGVGNVNSVKRLPSLKRVFSSGEALKRGQAKKFYRLLDCDLVNLYGPTEATVDVSYYNCPKSETFEIIPIGKPIDNTRLYILDNYANPVPVGVPGQLHIAGICLARGYLNRPELTRGSFEKPPLDPTKLLFNYFSPLTTHHSPLYQTGDLARWLPQGDIEFLGRIDHQVKIRGFRIEPGEIEALLHKHPAVKNAFITIIEDTAGEKSLAAFVIPTTPTPQTTGTGQLVKDLRDYIGRHVPAYMVPADFILLDNLPLTASGKVDRKKLESLRIASRELGLKRGQANIDDSHEKPRSRIESILANTWAEVLGVPAESIGIYDSFMILGGDSIKAVQVAARLQRYHLTAAVGDILLYPQIANLAPYIKERKRIPSQVAITGPVLPLPITRKFLFDNKRHVFAGHHFNQSQVLFREAGFAAEIIRKIFEKLTTHHDALRMTARFTENDFTLSIQGTDVPLDRLFQLEIIDLTSKNITGAKLLKLINSESNRIQAGLNLEQGPLVRLGLFKTNEGDYLLIVIHHLVIDGISWRILLEDFETAYRQIQDGHTPETLQLPLKTDSYQSWTQHVYRYAGDPVFLKQKDYWQDIKAKQAAPLPVDNPVDVFLYRDSAVCDIELSIKDTRQLLTNANRAYTTETNDLILSALTLALHAWTGKNVFKIDIEGHGRETGALLQAADNDTQEELELSRTIGWFTTSYPIVLATPIENENDEKSCLSPFMLPPLIQNVKETLRRIPDHGFGFGILEYLTPNGNGNPADLLPEICFNYLGEITSPGNPTNNENKLFNILDIPQGSRLDPNYPRLYRLDLRARVMDGKFQMAVTYNRHEFQRETIPKFTRAFKNNLRRIILHCKAQKQTIRTVSDFFAGSLLTPSVLQIINERFGLDRIEDIYPLTPMQEGMLYYWLQHRGQAGQGSRAYFQQLEITLAGPIDPGILEKAFKQLLKQHEILRSVLICDTPGQPLRATLKLLPKSWGTTRYEHISLENYKAWDRDTGFDLVHGPMVRLALFKTGDNTFTLIWSFHHILMDGWCIRMVLGDLLTIYSALSQGKTPEVPITQPYSFYLRWLARQDKYKDKARQYWSNYLAGLNTPTIIPAGKQENPEHSAEIYFQVDELLTQDLHQLANRCSVTLNTVLQCLWGLLLMECNHNTDIVFGSVVSGRPPEIRGVEHMIGLFINTQPVRVTVSEGMIFSALLARMQRDNVAARKYEFFSLADIQALSPLKHKLISHIMVVENYPVSAAAPGSLTILNIQAHEQSNYDFSLIVRPGKQIQFKVIFNPHSHDSQWINETFQRLISLARQVTSQPDAAIAELGILPIGKNDLQALPLAPAAPVAYDPPSTGWEKLVAAAWAEILGIDISTIGRNHDFFALGGHSLKGMYLSAHIRQSSGIVLEPGDIFKNPTLKEIAQCLEHKQRASSIVIPPAEKRHFYPVTAAQKRMFLLHGMEGGTGIGYNIPMLFEIHGQLDIKRLETAFEKLCQRHETLRTSFHMLENGDIVQRIEPQKLLTKQKFLEVSEPFFKKVLTFDLSNPPLFRAMLFAVADDHYQLLLDFHHLIFDGLSLPILTRDLSAFYKGESLPGLPIQYKDWALYLQNQPNDAQEKYWLERFQGEIPILELPTDFPRPTVRSYEGDRIEFPITDELNQKLHAFELQTNTTRYMILLAIYSVMLMKYTSQEDIIIGSPAAGRSHGSISNLIGMFVNTLCLRTQPFYDLPFRAFLETIKDDCVHAFNNADYPFDQLVEKLQLQREISRNPLFDAMFVLQNFELTDFSIPGLVISRGDAGIYPAKLDLTLAVREEKDQLIFVLDYASSLFKKETIQRMSGHLLHLMQEILDDPEQRLFEMNMLDETETRRLLLEFNGSALAISPFTSLHHAFSNQAQKDPDTLAVIAQESILTYGYLDILSNALAYHLHDHGTRESDRVGIMMERSAAAIIAIMGTLKAGAIYVPLDPDYPQERIRYMLEDCKARILLTDSEKNIIVNCQLSIINCQRLRKWQSPQAFSHHLSFSNHSNSYIIYTSGSTGKPKGVLGRHDSVLGLVKYFQDDLAMNSTQRVLQIFSLSFDASVGEIFPCLLSGAGLYIASTEIKNDPQKLEEYINTHYINLALLIPSLLELLEPGHLPTLKVAFSGASASTPAMAEKWNQLYINTYGPTETTVMATAWKYTGSSKSVPIGKPLPGWQVYILGPRNTLQGTGIPGEICISGCGLTEGYLNQPELTRGSFEKPPAGTDPVKLLFNYFTPFTTHHSPIYHSGDLGRWLPDGNLEFLGRLDNQVKIRGFRIEPGEIEKHLQQHPELKDTTVITVNINDNIDLCAYFTLKEPRNIITIETLRQFLSQHLPDYMIPAYFVRLETLPRTLAGKIDKTRLPKPEADDRAAGGTYVPARGSLEKTLVETWAHTLGMPKEKLSITHNFFSLGGDSIKAIQLVSRLRSKKLKLELRDLLTHPTIAESSLYVQPEKKYWQEQAALIPTTPDDTGYGTFQESTAETVMLNPTLTKKLLTEVHHCPETNTEIENAYPLSPMQKGMLFHRLYNPTSTAYHQQIHLQLSGTIDQPLFEQTVNLLIERYDVFRTRFVCDRANEPRQEVLHRVSISIPLEDISHLTPSEQEEVIENLKNREGDNLFDLTNPPLLRMQLIKTNDLSYQLLWSTHHIIMDGWCFPIILKDLFAIYSALTQGHPVPNPHVTPYSQYIQWLENQDKTAAASYWQNYLQGISKEATVPPVGKKL